MAGYRSWIDDIDLLGLGAPCEGCDCCTRDGCRPGGDCPVGGPSSGREGESLCPCTEPIGAL